MGGIFEKPNWGYYSVELTQSQEKIMNYYHFGSIFSILSTVGGYSLSIYSICFFILEGYQLFSYEKSAFKLLFFEDSKEPEEFRDRNNSYNYAGR